MIAKIKLALTVVTLAFVVSCGGGGGGGGSGQNNIPAPIVALTSSGSTAYQGDSVTLTWSATNATTCTASGAWNNSIGTSGTQTISVATLGSNVFTISCGNGSQTANAQTTVTVSVKPYFVEVPNAFPDPGYMYTLGANGIVSGPNTGGIIFATPIKKLPNGSPGIIYSAGMSNPDPTK
jgi:hypothetical protein